jgi:hypothetical protein
VKIRLKLLLCSLALAGCLIAQKPQGTLTNQRIGDLVQAGVTTDEIIRIIISAPKVNFDLRPGSTDNLLSAGVTEDVIKAMAARESGRSGMDLQRRFATSDSQIPHHHADVSSGPAITEVGVYYRTVSGTWTRMMPEIANWKTGGVVKSAGTLGIIKKDLNGRINGPAAKTHLKSAMEVLIYCPVETEITEYQLLKLRRHSKSREFRTATGGVFHQSGGSNRDLVPFDPSGVAPRSYVISLSGLGDGQYALMPPGSYLSHGPSAQLGKVYTFSISE